MTDVHAAIGHEQLKKLPKFNEARKRNAKFLSEHLQGVTVPYVPSECEHVYHQYTIRVANGKRDAMIEHLKKNEIGCGVYYPVPVHQQNYYTKDLGYKQSLPETEKAALEVLSLPVHPGLSPADLESIVSAVNEFAG
jgi:dTDP-4-amino-4,6-dideoxygalactose transaminase